MNSDHYIEMTPVEILSVFILGIGAGVLVTQFLIILSKSI